ncbi:hypothetical protein [Kumtagia ephedrae]|uniref:Lipoprotein n=1 Tax=Kumtagia ephedrae TaxID=2116701 RepID=A0A2P7SDP1_9HYPH|nr:hypothetical protein [Mesorhizobium ephedrae]PSJ60587.1 hypothetical protein C7I84_11480 [Mesorhizobium ephedrae]
MRKPLLAGAVMAMAVLAACSSTQDVLEPSAITPPAQGSTSSTAPDPSQSAAAPAAASSTPAPPTGPSAALVANARIQFAPIVGTSVEAATALSERLASRARERGMRLTGSADTSTTHMLKGYFTPLVEGKETTVIYVWDVYDPTGNRIHRISGQQKAASADGDGWASVPSTAMQAIADQTIDQLANWLAGASG